jgi:hypothetical protein
MMPAMVANWRRTSSTILEAARPTCVHREAAEEEGHHDADEHAHEHLGIHQVHLVGVHELHEAGTLGFFNRVEADLVEHAHELFGGDVGVAILISST